VLKEMKQKFKLAWDKKNEQNKLELDLKMA
jgi:hypothetical protein